jgi:hypothetical protein
VIANVGQADTGPVFRYFALDQSGGRGANLELATPLSASDLARTARIAVSFTARPHNASSDKFATTLQDDVYVRSADPMNPTGAMTCL